MGRLPGPGAQAPGTDRPGKVAGVQGIQAAPAPGTGPSAAIFFALPRPGRHRRPDPVRIVQPGRQRKKGYPLLSLARASRPAGKPLQVFFGSSRTVLIFALPKDAEVAKLVDALL